MKSGQPASPRVVIIGAGFTGLAAGYELSRRGIQVTLLEVEAEIGGLAASFQAGGGALERFYHHWFTSDQAIMQLIEELGAGDRIERRDSRTGMYYANRFYRLSTPLDLLRFRALPLVDRIRLGLLALRARRVADWRALEGLTAREWLLQLGGPRVYRVVWEPLLKGKFGDYADRISAVWFWNKLKLRGSSRGQTGQEQLAYFRGGFSALCQRLAAQIRAQGGEIRSGTAASGLEIRDGAVQAVITGSQRHAADAVIATPALPLIADLLQGQVPDEYLQQLRRIEYLANLCLVLQLDRSLSDTYWLNVNDPDFPFVGIIEHTNFEPSANYGGRHIVYLSRYLHHQSELFRMNDAELLEYALPYLQRMFPQFQRDWILDFDVWRARYAQPVVERHYGQLIPDHASPVRGLFIASMAQIYPEDRGTNYAVRDGRKVAALVADRLGVTLL